MNLADTCEFRVVANAFGFVDMSEQARADTLADVEDLAVAGIAKDVDVVAQPMRDFLRQGRENQMPPFP